MDMTNSSPSPDALWRIYRMSWLVDRSNTTVAFFLVYDGSRKLISRQIVSWDGDTFSDFQYLRNKDNL